MKRSTFFAFGIAVLTLITVSPATSAEWATLKGVFHFGDMSTKIPSRKKLVPNKDIQVCCRTTLLDESLIVNNDNRGVANVVIWVYKPTRIHPEANMPPATPMRIDNVNCRFHPHVAAVQTGRDLVIGNLDPVGHNCLIHFMRNPGVNPA